MNGQSPIQQMENWGYYLLPKSHTGSIGYTGLLVAIREKPTEMHFDPVSLHLRLRRDELAQWQTLGLTPLHKKYLHVCPGRMILRDHKRKEVEFFTFGGSLDTLSVPGETVYSLRSPAPILLITDELKSAADQFAFETEDVLASYAARWGLDQEGYAQRLAKVNATQFYLANIHAVLLHLEKSQILRQEYHHLCFVLKNEKKWLEDVSQWPILPVSLDELFAPDAVNV